MRTKYIESAQYESYFEATDNMWKMHLSQIFSKNDLQQFRTDKFWNEENDMVLKHNQKLLEFLFKKYSANYDHPNKDKICLEGFKDIFKDAQLLIDTAIEKDIL